MKILDYFIAVTFIVTTTLSCEKDNHIANSIDDLCAAIPDGWECEIIDENFNENDIPRDVETPVAIMKFSNTQREFITYMEQKATPSLILDIYPIEKKNDLIAFIYSQQIYSWCIPIYYGETKNYFIITSPCFINGGSFNDEANASIDDFHNALKSKMIINNYND